MNAPSLYAAADEGGLRIARSLYVVHAGPATPVLAPMPPTVDDLGGDGCLYLAALLTAQQQRAAIAPTRRMSLDLLQVLAQHAVIQTAWAVDPRAEITPVEGLPWRFAWSAYQREGLLATLQEFLETLPRDPAGLEWRVRVWNALAAAEAEAFFEQQLIKHHFDPTWARELTPCVERLPSALSIAQWRYCAWAATRHGASVAMQRAAQHEVRGAVLDELQRRAERLATGAWGGCAFPPFRPWPDSALAQEFVRHLTGLGERYRTEVPTVEALRVPRRSL